MSPNVFHSVHSNCSHSRKQCRNETESTPSQLSFTQWHVSGMGYVILPFIRLATATSRLLEFCSTVCPQFHRGREQQPFQ